MPGELKVALRLVVDSKGFAPNVQAAETAVAKLGGAAARAGQSARKQATGQQAANAEMRRAAREQRTAAARARRLARATRSAAAAAREQAGANRQVARSFFEAHGRLAAYLAGGLGIHQIIRGTSATLANADSYTELNNRLRLVTGSEAALVATRRELLSISQDTRTALDANASLYSRLALSAEATGHSQAQLLRVTELLNKQVLIGGSNASEAASGLVQFAQGLASGRLQGDELRSVMENLLGVQQGLVTGFRRLRQQGQIDFDVTRANIRDLAAEGVLSADLLIEAVLASGDETERKFKDVTITIEGGLQRVRNTALQLVGDLDSTTEASARVGEILGAVAQQMSEVDARALAEDLASIGKVAGIVIVAGLGRLTLGVAGFAAQQLRANAATRAWSATARFGAARSARLAAAHVAGAAAANRHRVAIHRLSRAFVLLRGGLTALGGPVGLALLAAYGMFEFARANRDVKESLGGLPDDVHELRDALQGLSRTELVAAESRVVTALTDARRELADATADAERTREGLLTPSPGITGGGVSGLAAAHQTALERQQNAERTLNGLLDKQVALRNQLRRLNEQSTETSAAGAAAGVARENEQLERRLADIGRRHSTRAETIQAQINADLSALDEAAKEYAAQIAALDRRIETARGPGPGAGQSIAGAPSGPNVTSLEQTKATIEAEEREIIATRTRVVRKGERQLTELRKKERLDKLREVGYEEATLERQGRVTREILDAQLQEQLELRQRLVDDDLLSQAQANEESLVLHANHFTAVAELARKAADERNRILENERQRRRDAEIKEYEDRLARAQGYADAAALIEAKKDEAVIAAKYQYNQEVARVAVLANRLAHQQGVQAIQTGLEIAKQGFGALAQHSKAAFAAYKAAAIAQTIISTYQSAQDSYRALAAIPVVGPALGIAAAAAAIAAGFARVNAIRAQQQPQGFARGGVVDSPVFFSARGIPSGVAGEAGPEAILPLSRGPGGQLGVANFGAGSSPNVTVNTSLVVHVQGDLDDDAIDLIGRKLERRQTQAMLRVMRDQQRAGGLLNRTEAVA